MKTKTHHLLLAAGLCLSVVVAAQQPIDTLSPQRHSNSLSLAFGPGWVFNYDPLASPFYYRRVALPVQLAYRAAGPAARQQLEAGFLMNRLHSKISGQLGNDSHTALFVAIHARYDYLHSLRRPPGAKGRFFAGGGVYSAFIIRNYDYGRGIAEETLAEPFTTLTVGGAFEYALRPGAVLTVTSCLGGFFNFSFRNPYGLSGYHIAAVGTEHSLPGAYLRLGSFSSFNRLVYWDGRVRYALRMSERWSFDLVYALAYHTYFQPLRDQTFRHTLLATFRFQF